MGAVLALHSSSDVLGVGVHWLGGSGPVEASRALRAFPLGRGLSNQLLSCMEQLLPADQWPQLIRLAVATGPGGFTGTRLTVVLARTDAEAANLLTSDHDANDKPFLTGERTQEGFYRVKNGLEQAISRGVAYAPYADLVWCETSTPDIAEAKKFAEAMQKAHPGKMLAYNCSPSFNWRKNLDDATIATFQKELGAMGYKFQFITLAGFHMLNHGMFSLASAYKERGMSGYVELQEREFADANKGFTAVKHQREVGVGYFDAVAEVISGGQASTKALKGSTEEEQFH